MRHVEIGVIKQVKTSNKQKMVYLVSLLKNKENKKFENLNDAKVFCEEAAHSILAEGEVSAVCFKYKRITGFSSFIMYDYLWDRNAKNHLDAEFSEYEETEFEYMDSHVWNPYWKKAQKVNERSYSAGDVLRASISHSPLYVACLIVFSSLIFSIIIILLSMVFYNANTYMSRNYGVVDTLVFVQAFFVICGLASTIIPYVKITKIIKDHNRNFNEVDWKEQFVKRQKFTYLTFGILSIAIIICVAMYLVVEDSSFMTQHIAAKVKTILILLIAFHLFMSSLILCAHLYVYLKVSRLVSHLFAKPEWDQFKKWMKSSDPIWEFRTSVDFFVIPHEYSMPFVNHEKELVNAILKDYETQEIKQIAKKSRKGYKIAIKKHFDIKRGKHGHIR